MHSLLRPLQPDCKATRQNKHRRHIEQLRTSCIMSECSAPFHLQCAVVHMIQGEDVLATLLLSLSDFNVTVVVFTQGIAATKINK